METDFGCRIENMAILYHSVVGHRMVQNEWASGKKHTKKEISMFKTVEKECEAVFMEAASFPGAGEA
jgi:hypothetical protein